MAMTCIELCLMLERIDKHLEVLISYPSRPYILSLLTGVL